MKHRVPLPPNTPVLVGVGVVTQREEDCQRAHEPLKLMLAAVLAAGRDAGAPAALTGIQYLAVPHGRWRYRNPAGAIAREVGARQASSVLASVGVLQQTLIGEACERIARGESHTTLVTGADAGYRLLRAQISGTKLTDLAPDDEPDCHLSPKDDLLHPAEIRAGLNMPVGLYALMESAFRAQQGWTVAEHRERLAALYARFSAVAVNNPHAWHRQAVAANTIRDASPHNPMQAFPYTRHHCSTWNVDQAGALLFCSAARAEQLGVPRERWIFPLASTLSNHMVTVSARTNLASCPGARIAGEAALAAAGLTIEDIDLVELYSCFPIAVQTYAAALGLSLEGTPTFTGGMPFAGGPYNNYVFQTTCRAAELLRQGPSRTALISSVSGLLTKQGFGVWSRDPAPQGYCNADLSAAVARECPALEVAEAFTGPGVIVGYTVLHGRGLAPRGVALLDLADGRRALVTTEDPPVLASFETEEWVGRRVFSEGHQMRLAPP